MIRRYVATIKKNNMHWCFYQDTDISWSTRLFRRVYSSEVAFISIRHSSLCRVLCLFWLFCCRLIVLHSSCAHSNHTIFANHAFDHNRGRTILIIVRAFVRCRELTSHISLICRFVGLSIIY